MRWPWTKEVEPEEVPAPRPLRDVGARFEPTTRLEVVRAANGMAFDAADTTTLKQVGGMTGGNIPDAALMWYASQSFPGYSTLAVLAQHWLINKACKVPAKDAARDGWTLSVDPELQERVKRLDKKFKVHKNLVEAEHFARVFGIRVVMFRVTPPQGVKLDDYLAAPFNPDGVTAGSYYGISQIDPYWMAPILDGSASSQPDAIDYYEPTWWMINGRRVHKSHLVVIIPDEVPDVLKPSYLYGGLSVPQKIYERVYAAERTANEAPMLMLTKRLNVQKVDIAKAVANQRAFELKADMQAEWRDNFGTLFIDHTDTAEQFETALTGVDLVTLMEYQLVASVANVPVTKLMGQSPKGFNATGEHDEANYSQELESIQADHFDPILERHYLLLSRSKGLPELEGVDVLWPAMDSPTKAEQADINLKHAQAAQIYSDVGAVDGAEIRAKLLADKDSGYDAQG